VEIEIIRHTTVPKPRNPVDNLADKADLCSFITKSKINIVLVEWLDIKYM